MIKVKNNVLRHRVDIWISTLKLLLGGFILHSDTSKNWDLDRILHLIMTYCRRVDFQPISILEVGSGKRAFVLRNLAKKMRSRLNLIGVDRLDKGLDLYRKNGIEFINDDIFTVLDSEVTYDVIVSQSVLEHIGDHKKCVALMCSRLNAGGLLVMSFDYFPAPIDCSGIYPYGSDQPEMKVFDLDDVREIIDLAMEMGMSACIDVSEFTPNNPIKPVVRWDRCDREYSFALLAFTKNA